MIPNFREGYVILLFALHNVFHGLSTCLDSIILCLLRMLTICVVWSKFIKIMIFAMMSLFSRFDDFYA